MRLFKSIKQTLFYDTDLPVVFSPETWHKQFSQYDFAEALYSSLIQEMKVEITNSTRENFDLRELINKIKGFAGTILPTAYIDGIEQLHETIKLLSANNHQIRLQKEFTSIHDNFLQLLAQQPMQVTAAYNKEIKFLLPKIIFQRLTTAEFIEIIVFYKTLLNHQLYVCALQNLEFQLRFLAYRNNKILYSHISDEIKIYITTIQPEINDARLISWDNIKQEKITAEKGSSKIETKTSNRVNFVIPSWLKTTATTAMIMQNFSAAAAATQKKEQQIIAEESFSPNYAKF